MGLTVNQWLVGFDSLMRSQEFLLYVTYPGLPSVRPVIVVTVSTGR
jgi:hypothetical protein